MSDVEFNKLPNNYETIVSQQSQREVRKWRVEGKVDRSKRTYSATPEVSVKNVLPKTQVRPRVAYEYNIVTKDAFMGAGQNVSENGALPKKKKNAAKSANTYEKRLARSMELLSVKGKKTKKSSKKDEDSDDEEEEEEEENEEKENVENEADDESAEKVEKVAETKPVEAPKPEEPAKSKDESKSKTEVRSRQNRKSVGGKSSSGPQLSLDSKVISQLKRLGANPAPINEPRSYASRQVTIPKAVQEFLDAKLPANKQFFYTPEEIVFTEIAEFVLQPEELDDFEFCTEHKDQFILIADGDRVLATLQSETSGDFNVYIISEGADDVKPVVGPIRISQFLKDVEMQDKVGDSSLNESTAEDN